MTPKELHEAALEAAVNTPWVFGKGPHANAAEALIAAYHAYLKAHGWKLTPREPTPAMFKANDMQRALPVGHDWQVMHDAAPAFGDA